MIFYPAIDIINGKCVRLSQGMLEHKKICDVGCGTGILSIIAEKIGAIEVDAVDIVINCIENTIDNINRNNCKKNSGKSPCYCRSWFK